MEVIKNEEKTIEIRGAAIRDLQCNYSYELLTGKTKGDIINRKGVHMIHDDLRDTFSRLNVFLAHIDGAFTHWTNNQTPLEELEGHDDTMKYEVTAFKITGVEENQAVILSGHKDVDSGSISFETPKIKLNGSYLYLSDLEEVMEQAINGVEAYLNGKCAPQLEQTAIEFDDKDEMMADFNEAKV